MVKQFSKSGLYCIILAAGLSSRMDFFKPTMLIGRQTLVEHLILLYKSVKINNIIVITGYRAQDVNNITRKYNIKSIYNKKYYKGMFSSIVKGVSQLPESTTYFFIHPVDIPLVNYHTIHKLISIAKTEKKIDVIYPIFDNKRGHPPLISINLKKKIMNWNDGGGLNLCLKNNAPIFINVPVADKAILMDADTVMDYDQLVLKFNKKDLLTPKECIILMQQVIHTPNKVIIHCKIVAKVAIELAKKINDTGKVELDTALIYSSALVHDVAKNYKNHDKVGGAILKKMGYVKMGEIIENHINLRVEKNDPITESEIVYVADKLVSGDKITDLKIRFRKKLKHLNNYPDVKSKVVDRMKNAYYIKKKIEKLTLKTIENIISKTYKKG